MASSGVGGGGAVVGGGVVGAALVGGGVVGAALVGAALVGAGVVARLVVAGPVLDGVPESLSASLQAPAFSSAITMQGATRRAWEGLTPATIPATVRPVTAVGRVANGVSDVSRDHLSAMS